MDKLIVTPHIAIGKVKLGMQREEVHRVMGKDFDICGIDKIRTDGYYHNCFQVSYNQNDIVDFITIANGITDYYQVIFDEVDVFHTTAKDLVQYIENFAKYNDDLDSELGYSYTFEDIGISLWRPIVFKEETLQETWFQKLTQEEKEDETIHRYFEAVAVWTKGYYDVI